MEFNRAMCYEVRTTWDTFSNPTNVCICDGGLNDGFLEAVYCD